MKYAIFSDIHSNLEAFEAVIEDSKKEQVGQYLCIGDIVGYAVNPIECVNLVKGLNCITVSGNHDVAAYDLRITKNFTDNARIAAEWTNAYLGGTVEKDYLKSLPMVFNKDDWTLVHSSLDNPQDFNYVYTLGHARASFTFQDRKVCFIGHTHRPVIFRKIDEDIEILDSPSVEMDDFSKYLINVGSVGQPRDRDNRASYCIFDDERKTIEIKRVPYDFSKTAAKIIKAGLPKLLAERLIIGGSGG